MCDGEGTTEDKVELIAEALSRGVADKYKRILAIIEESPPPQPSATAEVEAHTSCPICGRSFSAAADCKQPCQHCNDFMSAAKPVTERVITDIVKGVEK